MQLLTHMCARACGDPRLMLGTILDYSSTHALRQHLSIKSRAWDTATLSSQLTLGSKPIFEAEL